MTYTELSRYVSRVAADWPDPDGRRWQRIDGTLVFVDISGFTPLSERLTRFGRVGAEELTELLSRVFGDMLDLAYARGGALLKFGGDALLFFFDGADHAIQACSAAVEMRSSLRSASRIPTSVGKVKLKMSVGVHSGEVDFFLVGDSHRELLVTGPAATGTTSMEKIAEAGEVVVSAATKALLPEGAASVAKSGGWLLNWRRGVAEKRGVVTRAQQDHAVIARLISVALRDHLSSDHTAAEHRTVTVAFVRFGGLDAVLDRVGGDETAAALHGLVTLVQAAAEHEGVTFLDTDIDVDGGKILLYAGIPIAQEDDTGRMLRTVRRVMDEAETFTLQIGVNRGHAYAGQVGTKYRSAFAVMGDTVNTAARVMAAAPSGSIYATPAALERSSTLFDAVPLEPLKVKGKQAALAAYSLGSAIGRREERDGGLPYVGRAPEVAQLTGAFRGARQGFGSVWCVHGRGGAGKSRLVHEVLRSAPLPTLEIRAEAYGAESAYHALRAPFRELLGLDGATRATEVELARAVNRLAPDLLGLLPLLADVTNIDVEPTPECDALDPRFRREVLADMVERLLAVARPGPLAIIVDDAHWLDQGSMDLLDRLATATQQHPWVTVVLRRNEPSGYTPSNGTPIELRPLTIEHAEQLVHLATEGAPLHPSDVAAIVDRADGVPLVLEEIVRAFRLAGGVDHLPDSVEEMIAIQIDELGPLARTVLRYAAVFGRRFPSAPFEDVLAAERVELDAATREQLDGVLLQGDDGYVDFRHALVQEVAYNALSYRRRRELHGIAGDGIVRVNADDPERAAGVLSLHFERAGRDQEAWRFATYAGDRANEAFANAEAGLQYERALGSAIRLASVSSSTRARLWVQLGDVREREGMFDAALEAYRRAAKEVDGDQVAVAEMWLKRARARERAGHFVSALRDITQGLRMLQSPYVESALRARLLAFRAVVRQGEGRPQRALAEAYVAVEAAELAEDLIALGQAYSVIDWAHLVLGEPEQATFGEETLRIYESLGDLEGQGKAMNTIGAVAYFADRWDDAAQWYERARGIGVRTGNHVQAAISAMNIGEIHLYLGRFDEAEPLLRDAVRVFTATGFADGRALAETYLGRMLLERGDLDEADACLTSAREEFQQLHVPGGVLEASVHLAECRARRGDSAVVVDLIEPALAAAGNEPGALEPAIARVRAEALAAEGQWSAARAQIDEGLDAADRHGLPFERRLLLQQLARFDLIDLTDGPATASSRDRLVRTVPR